MIPFEVIALSPYAREFAADYARRRATRRFRDRTGRSIAIGEWQPNDWAGLLAMYTAFGGRSARALPFSAERRAVWLEQLLSRGPNVVARASERIVGHAALVEYDGGDSYELVVYVHRDYQRAGIGRALVDAVLQRARRDDVRRIWLTFERDNCAAASLFQQVGFRPAPNGGVESVAAASWGVEVWTLAVADAPRVELLSLKRAVAAVASASHMRLREVAHALRLVMIPLVCALVIAAVSDDPRGRMLGVGLAILAVVFGLVLRGRAILFGSQNARSMPNDAAMSTGEWMSRLR